MFFHGSFFFFFPYVTVPQHILCTKNNSLNQVVIMERQFLLIFHVLSSSNSTIVWIPRSTNVVAHDLLLFVGGRCPQLWLPLFVHSNKWLFFRAKKKKIVMRHIFIKFSLFIIRWPLYLNQTTKKKLKEREKKTICCGKSEIIDMIFFLKKKSAN